MYLLFNVYLQYLFIHMLINKTDIKMYFITITLSCFIILLPYIISFFLLLTLLTFLVLPTWLYSDFILLLIYYISLIFYLFGYSEFLHVYPPLENWNGSNPIQFYSLSYKSKKKILCMTQLWKASVFGYYCSAA